MFLVVESFYLVKLKFGKYSDKIVLKWSDEIEDSVCVLFCWLKYIEREECVSYNRVLFIKWVLVSIKMIVKEKLFVIVYFWMDLLVCLMLR